MLVRLNIQGPGDRIQDIDIEAASEADAIRVAVSRGARVLSIAPRAAAPGVQRNDRSGFPTVLFSQELLALLEAGLNLTEALATLHAKEQRRYAREVMGDLLRALREGRNFSD